MKSKCNSSRLRLPSPRGMCAHLASLTAADSRSESLASGEPNEVRAEAAVLKFQPSLTVTPFFWI